MWATAEAAGDDATDGARKADSGSNANFHRILAKPSPEADRYEIAVRQG
jgi:hypothetical protein